MSSSDAVPRATVGHEQGLADLADAIVHTARLIRLWDQAAETVVPLSLIEAAVLEHVDRHPGCRPSDVARELRMRSSNFSAALRVLEKQGFVERRAARPTAAPRTCSSRSSPRRTSPSSGPVGRHSSPTH